jgi:hypothetical protein
LTAHTAATPYCDPRSAPSPLRLACESRRDVYRRLPSNAHAPCPRSFTRRVCASRTSADRSLPTWNQPSGTRPVPRAQPPARAAVRAAYRRGRGRGGAPHEVPPGFIRRARVEGEAREELSFLPALVSMRVSSASENGSQRLGRPESRDFEELCCAVWIFVRGSLEEDRTGAQTPWAATWSPNFAKRARH